MQQSLRVTRLSIRKNYKNNHLDIILYHFIYNMSILLTHYCHFDRIIPILNPKYLFFLTKNSHFSGDFLVFRRFLDLVSVVFIGEMLLGVFVFGKACSCLRTWSVVRCAA